MGFFYFSKGQELAKHHADSASKLYGKISDALSNINNIRLFSRAPYESQYLSRYQREEVKNAIKVMWHLEELKLLQGIASLAFIIATLIFEIEGWKHGWVTIGDFSLISMLSYGALSLVWFMGCQVNMFVREMSRVISAIHLFTIDHEIVDKPNAKDLLVTHGRIDFSNVTFGYRKDKPLFKQLNVLIEPAQHVGLVGLSGSGKSSFVNLLLRLYELSDGKIMIDNQSITEVKCNSLRDRIAMIPQDPTLFNRTIMENIRYASIEATDEQVIEAAKRAHCHEFIMDTEKGYQSLIGNHGVKLSGGQKQRIAIARAILKNAPILILDEATSALDSVTEQLIHKSMSDLMRNKTTLVIAHRLSTLADMDRLLVFDRGLIVEDDTMENLLSIENGYFKKLWMTQLNGFIADDGNEGLT